jgi:hypothetical protein
LIFIAPATVLGPGLLLASLVVGINLLTEGIARVIGAPCRARNSLWLATSILSVKGLTVGFGSAAPVVEDVRSTSAG